MKWKTWHEADTDKNWNVIAAENDINKIRRFAKMHIEKNPDLNLMIHVLYDYDPKLEELVSDAGKEMADILSNKANSCGYHINHITSGKSMYSLYANNCKVYSPLKEKYQTKQAAEESIEKGADAYVEKVSAEGETFFCIYTLDNEATDQARSYNTCGKFIAEFDSREEAEAEGETLGSYYIEESVSDEYWVVVENSSNKAAYPIMFPSETRALAFLYRAALPSAWMQYANYICGKGNPYGKC